MTIDLLTMVLAGWLGSAGADGTFGTTPLWPDVTFRPRERAVSNWRREAASHLEASYGFVANVLLGRDPAQVTRCVRLNNYWCIKRAGWAGEIAADADGHVAFASAAEGADVAALLLRRYYVDYGRKTALAIVSRWAPAACGPGSAVPGGRVTARIAAGGPARAAADHLTTHGLGHTLRARFLASRGHRMAGPTGGRVRRSVIPDRLIGRGLEAPAIAVGLGELPLTLGELKLDALPVAGPTTGLASEGRLGCFDDSARIRTYAAKAAAGVAANATQDLKLFDADGKPTPNLARVMHNMSAVEIGPLGARAGLIAAAVERAADVAARRLPLRR